MSGFLAISLIVAVSFSVWRMVRRTRFFLHSFQLHGYASRPFGAWLRGQLSDSVIRVSHALGLLLILLSIWTSAPNWLLFLLWAGTFASSRRYRRDRPKKPLSWTARMKRLGAITGACLVGFISLPSLVSFSATTQLLSGLWLGDLLSPIAVWLAAQLASPVEKRIREGFKKQARSRIAVRPDLEVIAITGSYGKTSVKFAIREILSQRYPTLATPGSFNTPMGICRVVNNNLTDEHRFAVLEMGMRHPGDIAELCEIVSPNIAVITSVGVAHMESMGSIEAIAAEKGSLLTYLASDGVAILNGDDDRVLNMQRGMSQKVITVSASGRSADFRAVDIRYDTNGAQFDVLWKDERIPFTTRLLGSHNVLNILMAIAVGHVADLSLRQMSHAIARLEPVEHRLEIKERGGLIVIDDAFNSNPVGAAGAVEVLGKFEGRRVIVTPGMIELGAEEHALNRAFGGQIASNVDDAVLVGPERTRPIAEGLISAGFPESRIHVVKSLFDAQDWVASNLAHGDVVLFENDLPDQFNES